MSRAWRRKVLTLLSGACTWCLALCLRWIIIKRCDLDSGALTEKPAEEIFSQRLFNVTAFFALTSFLCLHPPPPPPPPSSLPAEPRLLFLLMPSPAAVSMETPSYKLSDGASCLGLQEASGLHTCMKHMASFCVEHNAPLHPQPAASLLLLLHTYRFYFYKNLKSARIRCPLLNLSTTIPVFDEHVWVTSSPESFIPASEIWNVNIFWFIRH